MYVICSSYADEVEEYIQESKWFQPSSPFQVHIIKSPESQSVGDALRYIDSIGIINKYDFLLVSGDIVSNVDFKPILAAHKERKKSKDKNQIMTMVLREASVSHRTRARLGAGLFILDEPTQRCVRYEPSPRPNKTGYVNVDYEELLDSLDTISFRNDLIDCHIDICAPDIPALFTENFDYNAIRSDFVKEILTSDILGKTIYAHILDDAYSARVESFQTYDAVSKDVIARYSYPVTPERNIIDTQTYSYQHGHIYKEADVVLAQSCVIGSGTVIGAKSFIGDGTKISKSTIGRNVKIGKNVVIEGSYIWDNAVIEDGVSITSAVIGDGATVKQGATLEAGVIISFNVVVGADKTIKADTKLTTQQRVAKDSDDELASVGSGSVDGNYVFHDSDLSDYDSGSDEEYEKSVANMVYSMSNFSISDTSIHSVGQEVVGSKKTHRRYSSQTAGFSEAEEENFHHEAFESVTRSITENHHVDTALLELNTLRMTMNVSYHEVREATMQAFIAYIFKLINTGTKAVKPATEDLFEQWVPLLKRQVFDVADAADLLGLIQHECSKRQHGDLILAYAVNTLYDNDSMSLVDDEAVEIWWENEETQRGGDVLKYVAKVVESIRDADEESEEESD